MKGHSCSPGPSYQILFNTNRGSKPPAPPSPASLRNMKSMFLVKSNVFNLFFLKKHKSWFHYVLALNPLFSAISCYFVNLKLYVRGNDLR